jgi:hypothetical protein
MRTNAGKKFIECYIDANHSMDILALSLYRHGLFREEEGMFKRHTPNAQLIDLQCLSPFLFRFPWSAALEGKRILVVHPFKKSIRTQYMENRQNLFKDKKVLPAFSSLEIVGAVQSIGGENKEFTDWFAALDSMKSKIDNCDFDLALLGCGAYGLPLAAHIKRSGKQAIYIGGVLQLLFGIKGKRWEGFPYEYDTRFYNENWIRPANDETPKASKQVEDACYW